MNIQSSINNIMNELDSIENRRESILKGSRDILIHCRKAIAYIHGGELDKARDYIEMAEKKHEELKEYAKEDLYHYLINVESEIVEARSLYSIVINLTIPTYDQFKVKGDSYILGLLDCIGEMKRMILDLLRKENYEQSLTIFKLMEEMYSLLLPFAIYDNIIQGVRRKLDQNRILIESVREIVTEESRRRVFLKELKNEI